MNLSVMGVSSQAFGFGYGKTGLEIVRMLEESGVKPCFLMEEREESRVNYMLVEEKTNDCTLIANRGPQPSESAYRRFQEMLRVTVQPGESVALAGDTSNFSDPMVYNTLMDLLADKRPRVFLDTDGAAFGACVLKKPFLVKPNRVELSRWYGQELKTERELIKAVSKLDALGVEVAAVSLGEEGSLVKAVDRLYRAKPPAVRLNNTVGCGDCFVAGLMRGFDRGDAPVDILRYATAVSAACAESPFSVGFDPARAAELMEYVDVRTI
jgi:1-phosphofructokinase family hexose kinase